MFLNEPARTPYDLHFSVLGIPVRVHPLFWLVALIFGTNEDSRRDPMLIVLWVLAFFVSILIHELGHALTFRYFGARPWITLYGMGGLASAPGGRFTPRSQILISLAGPVAGFALGAFILALVAAAGHGIRFDWRGLPGLPFEYGDFRNERLDELVRDLLFCNFFYNLLNLLPVLPLDGGQVCREVCQINNPRDGLRTSLMISIVVGAGIAILAMKSHQFIITILFAVLAFDSYTALERLSGRGGFGGGRW